jgi:hypothetical protein
MVRDAAEVTPAEWLRSRARIRLAALGLVPVAFVVFLAAYGRNQMRCKDVCFGPPPLSKYGSITYEPGHPWTRYAGSWQWTGQSVLGHLGLIAALLALGLAATDSKNPRPALVGSVVAMIAWGVWVGFSPPTS